jgi:hypothetical protein
MTFGFHFIFLVGRRTDRIKKETPTGTDVMISTQLALDGSVCYNGYMRSRLPIGSSFAAPGEPDRTEGWLT